MAGVSRQARQPGGRGFCLGAGKTQSQCLDKLDNQKMPENATIGRGSSPLRPPFVQLDWIAHLKRVSAGAPQRPVHIILALAQDALLGGGYKTG